MLVNFDLEGLEEKDKREIKHLLQTINDNLEGGLTSRNLASFRNTYVINAQDSLDASYPMYVHFNILNEMIKIVSVKVSFWILPFRAYDTTATMGGNISIGWANILFDENGFVKTSVTQGDYGIPEVAMMESIRTHTHGINYGIYEETNSPTIKFYISDTGEDLYSNTFFGGYTVDKANINITDYITRVGSKMIKFMSTTRARLSVQITIKLDIRAR